MNVGLRAQFGGFFFGRLIGQSHFFVRDHLAIPRTILTMRGDDDPFFAKRMPAFFPRHNFLLGLRNWGNSKKKVCAFYAKRALCTLNAGWRRLSCIWLGSVERS
jgi:hypothetical protein